MFRDRKWVRLSSDELLPGDIVSVCKAGSLIILPISHIAGKFGGELKFGGLAVYIITAKLKKRPKFPTRIYTYMYGDPHQI